MCPCRSASYLPHSSARETLAPICAASEACSTVAQRSSGGPVRVAALARSSTLAVCGMSRVAKECSACKGLEVAAFSMLGGARDFAKSQRLPCFMARMRPIACRDMEGADFPTLGAVLQHYPRDYRHYHGVLSEGELVQVPARVLSIWVQPMRRGAWLKAELEVWQKQAPPGESGTSR